jgi:OOP family OmpA-OmpF porin
MKNLSKALVAAGAVVAMSAHAEGLYVGGNLGSSHFKGDDIGGLSTDRSDTGLKVYGGYSLTPNLAFEAGYARTGKFNSAAGELKGSGLFVDAVGILPLGSGFSALGSVGLFNGKLSSSTAGSDHGMSYKLGAGLEYAINANVGVRGQWERYRFDALDIKASTDLYSVGVNYRF